GDALPAAVLGRPATAVTGGGLFFCARLDTSQVKCWGWNPNGQLGIGTTENQGDDPGEMAALPVTIALQPVYRPDGLLRRAAFAFVGNDVHNTTGTGQTRSATVGNQGAATFTLRAQNDGNFTDALRIRGTGTTSRFTVTYRRGATNITAQVLAGTYTLPGVAPGRTRDITVVIRARAGTPAGTTVSRTITTRSGTNPAIRDTVKATITRR
ncbi:MAG TPA: RCC1 domain-containing protein, partial [Acidimicrobiales bacterium]|nr:RCC1 domain-containing protein [Acidimicrobiales bacterium]